MRNLIMSLMVLLMLVGCGEDEQGFSIDSYLDKQMEICRSNHQQMVVFCYNDYYSTDDDCERIKDLDRCPRIVEFISDTYKKEGKLLHLNNGLVNAEMVCYRDSDGDSNCYETTKDGVYCYQYFNEDNKTSIYDIDCRVY